MGPKLQFLWWYLCWQLLIKIVKRGYRYWKLPYRKWRKWQWWLKSSLQKYMGERVELLAHGAGLHLLVKVLGDRTQEELIELARNAGVRVYPTESYWLCEESVLKNCVLIGFSAIPEEDIEPGIQALAHAWFD